MAANEDVVVGEEVRLALKKGRKWSAWMIIWGRAGPAAVDCGGVEDAMREELQAFFQDFAVAATFAGSEGDRMALRVCISERVSARSVQRKTQTIFLLYFLRSDLVLASTIKAEYAAYLKHALCRALGCNEVTDRGLSGRQADALKELVLAPTCSRDLLAALLADDAAVAGRSSMQKRRASHEDLGGDAAIPRDPAVTDEHLLSQGQGSHKRMRAHETATGPERSVPLENISIQVTEPNGKQVMKVTLNGPNALQGIRDLAGGGLLEEPPEQLRNLVLGIGVPSNDIKLVGTEQQPQPPKSLGGEEDETAPKK